MDNPTGGTPAEGGRRVSRSTALGLLVACALAGLAFGFSGIANADESSSTESGGSSSESTPESTPESEDSARPDLRGSGPRGEDDSAKHDSGGSGAHGDEDCPEPGGDDGDDGADDQGTESSST